MRKVVMLGETSRTRSMSSMQVPVWTRDSAAPLFVYSSKDFIFDLRQQQQSSATDQPSSDQQGPPHPKTDLKTMLISRWSAAKKQNVINYDLNCMYKLLPGEYNLSIQLNVERGQLRRKPLRFRNIREPFNNVRWNFTKMNESEILMYLRCTDRPITSDPLDRHVLAVNASPLERNHSLVVPAINKCLPQVLNESSVRLCTHMMLLINDENFHMLFNSLLGHASVNHLHSHALFWPYDSDLINRRFEQLYPNLYVIRPPDWFVPAFAFQLANPEQMDHFIRLLTGCVEFLSSRNVAHNVFFTRAQPIRTEDPLCMEDRAGTLPLYVTCYIFPRRSITGAKPPTNFNPAANELAGCLISYTWRFFESATEAAVLRIMQEEAYLSPGLLEDLIDGLIDRYSGVERHAPLRAYSSEDLTSPELEELHDSFHTFSSPKRRVPLSTADDCRARAASADSLL